jgi:hypothetical protein
LLKYQLHGFEEANCQRDEGLEEAIKSGFSQHPNRQELSETISGKIGPLKSWIETSVKSPHLPCKLDRVETYTLAHLSYSKPNLDSLQSQSDAFSSLSSQMFQLQDVVLGERADSDIDSDEALTFEYSCCSMAGTEQGFVENEWIYCKKNLLSDGWRDRGIHLVDVQSFASCDGETSSSSN